MTSLLPSHATSQTINSLLVKLSDADPDFRFMSLNDILTVLDNAKQDILLNDYNTAARTVDHIVKALDDQNGEVQNLAIKCLGPLVQKLPPQTIGPLIEKLSTMTPKNSVDNTVPSLALRAVIAALPRPAPGATFWEKNVEDAYNPISRVLIPRLLGKSTQSTKASASLRLPPFGEGLLDPGSMNIEAVDVLIELVHCFGPMLASYEVEALYEGVVGLLDSDSLGYSVKKRAVVAISGLAVYATDAVLDKFVQLAVSKLGDRSTARSTQRLYITIFGSIARSIPHRFGRHMQDIAPHIILILGEEELQQHIELINDGADTGPEFNDIREASLVALESFLASCPVEMRPFTDDTISSSLRYLRYDPNYSTNDDEDDEEMDEDEDDAMDGFDDDDEFDTGDGFDDDDDASWKVRRCAAKVIHTLIATRSTGDLLDSGVLYNAAASLVKRFDEREETVRLEIIAALSLLVRKTGEGHIPEFSLDSTQADYLSQLPPSRKRRRQSSGGGAAAIGVAGGSRLAGTGLTSPVLEKVPASGPRADLAKMTPGIVKAGTKLLKGKLLATKQAVINLFDDIVKVQSGGLSGYLDQIMDPTIEAMKPTTNSGTSSGLLSSGGSASATPVTLRVAALRLMSDVAKTHSSQLLQPHLSKIVVCVVAVVKDRFYKISAEAIQTVEEIVKAITPPRARKSADKFKSELHKLYEVIIDRMVANDADTEVRQKAIHALGILLARTSSGEGAELLAATERTEALGYLLERLRNETTRLSAVRAIDNMAASASGDVEFEAQWTQEVVVELSAQLRKSNRALRGASVQALSHLTHSSSARAHLGDQTVSALIADLQPVILNNDAHLLSPALHVMADLVQKNPELAINNQTIAVICELLRSPNAASALEPLVTLVTRVGQSGIGGPLMAGLLKDVGIGGDPAVVGKVIGNLLVSSGDSAGVTLDSFITEARNSSGDQARASLALAVLGEAGLRLGSKSPMTPDIFLQQFGTDFDKVSISAAVALGRAGAGNVEEYLPVILKGIGQSGSRQYLLLQSVKEILQQVSMSNMDIAGYLPPIWTNLLEVSESEDNKAIVAECIGRLVIIAPQTFVPKIQSLLQDSSQQLRAIAIQGLRYTLPESNDAFDAIIKEQLVPILVTVLQDKELEIRRLAMTALNSAAHNKPDLILSQLSQLLPHVMKESMKNQSLIREVQMGPFKHTVDDGLEVRKSAYETLYALMETAFSRLDIIQLYDRIIDGLRDDTDIRGLCNLMLSKLVYLAPEETTRRMDAIAAAFRATLSTKLKENAVKQEIEKQNEANRSVLRVSLLLHEKLLGSLAASGSGSSTAGGPTPVGFSPVWNAYWDAINKDHKLALKELCEENMAMRDTGGSAR